MISHTTHRLLSSRPPAMGPPTPTLHSAPVDENDPEYIRRAEGRRILANSFEAIFAKYGNMREEESDEIDFSKGVAGTIALDRGHLREMKEPKGPGQLLDTFFDHDENALAACGDSEDDIDELASPEPPSRRKDRKQDYRGEVRVQVCL
ncbi:hypothetical protein CC78DRAFT_528449 [Lojkania enalia]|uniref:Uncharacterized protein n=1 Tax=Lojkania enalia TaxID=147567 RepID=A0A9P4TRR8_9PLEO|nr:hypothetical protein CC78DRAFT_528449 [Didymosphaeria enalia]